MSALTFFAAVTVCAAALVAIILSAAAFVRSFRNGGKKSEDGKGTLKK